MNKQVEGQLLLNFSTRVLDTVKKEAVLSRVKAEIIKSLEKYTIDVEFTNLQIGEK